jgi:hypothetical protein
MIFSLFFLRFSARTETDYDCISYTPADNINSEAEATLQITVEKIVPP